MKKILLFLSAMTIVFALNAQNDKALSAIEKAKVATQNEKKATNPSTWIKLANAYLEAYLIPKGAAWLGASQTEVKLVSGSDQVISTENATIAGSPYLIDHYSNRDHYYNSNGVLEMILVTKPVLEGDILAMSLDAYLKANQLDAKGSKSKDIKEQLVKIRENYLNDAMAAYTLGNIDNASRLFEASLKATDNPVVNSVDSLVTYYTAITYNMKGDTEKAKLYFNKCNEIGYYQDGAVYSSLAEIEKTNGNIEGAKELLNTGFQKFPNSQSILISLINIYIESKDDPNKVLQLIRSAQKNEPNNASLIYAEGNLYKELGDIDNAVKCYYRSTEVDPSYIYGIYAVGNTYYDLAIAAQTKRDALPINDVKGYEECMKEFEDNLLKAIDPFEKAFNLSQDKEIKFAVAEGLKQIYFRFRDRSEEYMNSYKKYNEFVETNRPSEAK